MTTSIINLTDSVKLSDAAEWALCREYGIERVKHDSSAYDKDSDVNAGDVRISVKTSAFSLMAGSLCEGLEDFDAIWNLYERKVHSNKFAYVSLTGVCYMMNIAEFKAFVYEFCYVERESAKNGGKCKIRMRKESGKVIRWLENQAI